MVIAEPWRKWAGNFVLLANEFGRSKPKHCAKCGTRPAFVSSKDFLTRPRSNRNFFAGYWFNFRHESRRRSKIVGSAWPRPEGRAVAIFRSECCPSHPASSAGKSPVDWLAESAKNCADLIGGRGGVVNDYGDADFPPAFGAYWARAYSTG